MSLKPPFESNRLINTTSPVDGYDPLEDFPTCKYFSYPQKNMSRSSPWRWNTEGHFGQYLKARARVGKDRLAVFNTEMVLGWMGRTEYLPTNWSHWNPINLRHSYRAIFQSHGSHMRGRFLQPFANFLGHPLACVWVSSTEHLDLCLDAQLGKHQSLRSFFMF